MWPFRKPTASEAARSLNEHRQAQHRDKYRRVHDELREQLGMPPIKWAKR